MFTWKKKAPVVDEKVEESQEENKEEVTPEPATEKKEDEAKDGENEEVEEKSAEVEKESLTIHFFGKIVNFYQQALFKLLERVKKPPQKVK